MRKILFIPALALLLSCSRPEAVPEEQSRAAGPQTGQTSIEMGTEAQSHIGLEVITAKIQRLTEYLHVTGTIQPVDSRISHVRPLAAGRLSAVLVKVGDRVSANQTLAMFDNVEAGEVAALFQTARSEVEKLNVQLAVARQNSERSRQLSEIGAIPRKEYELSIGEERSILASIQGQESVVAGYVAKLRRFGLDTDGLNTNNATAPTAIRAPFGGVVIEADASPGEMIDSASELFLIADLSQVWVQGEVYEKDLGQIQIGRTASITVDTYPGREFPGAVTYISDILDPQTRTAKVRCEVANPGNLLKLDMFATVLVPTTFSADALAIPAEAIQQLAGKNVVFIRTGETTFEQKVIESGRTIRGLTEIVSGLEGGESVVTKGAFHLKSVVMGAEIGEVE